MRITTITALSLCLALPLAAQQQQAAEKDPTVKAKGKGTPAGWAVRIDDKDAARYTMDDVRFETMGSGWHVTSGPAALYWAAKDQATGAFMVSASLTQTKAPRHPEAYGIFMGGNKLDGAEQEYFYFLVRGNGQFYVAHRAGSEVHRIVPWTAHAAVKAQDADGKQTNTLAFDVTADSVHLLANGTRVKSFAKSEMHGFKTDGHAGLRVNHNLDIHVGSFTVSKR